MIDKKAYQKMDYALCLLSARADGKDSGCIINSFHQVTSSFPAKFTIAVNRENVTAAAVEQAGSFCVTLLAHDAPAALINDFGYRSGRVRISFPHTRSDAMRSETPTLPTVWSPGYPAV